MPKLYLPIPYPAFIESIVVYFLLRYRKKHYGVAFRRIKLIADKDVDAKHRYAIVDPQDYEKLAGLNWLLNEYSNLSRYAVKMEGNDIVRMHRIIMNAPAGTIVDHRDRNGLNNTRKNLRFATRTQNNCNVRRKTETKTSKYKGVSFVPKTQKWRAQIKYNGISKHLGYFENEEDAARAYDEAAKEYHGEFAVLNFNVNHEDTKSQKEKDKIKSEDGFVLKLLWRIGLFVKNLILLRFLYIKEMYKNV